MYTISNIIVLLQLLVYANYIFAAFMSFLWVCCATTHLAMIIIPGEYNTRIQKHER